MVLEAGLMALGAGLAVGLGALGSGIAEKDIGAAAVGAVAENQKFFGRALIFVVIPESLVIFCMIIAILLLPSL